MTEQPTPNQSTTTQICPLHPFGHNWDHTALTCSFCGTQRTAHDAIVSLLSGQRGWDTARAEQLVGQARAELMREVADALTGRHGSPESVSIARRLARERLCGNCEGHGLTSETTDTGGVGRRCRPCNGKGLLQPRHTAGQRPDS